MVIIGFGAKKPAARWIFDYEDPHAEPRSRRVRRINPYLVDALPEFLEDRGRPLCDVPRIGLGSMPNDGGRLLLEPEEREAILKAFPKAAPFGRRFLCADELLDRRDRWCLWLEGASPRDIEALPPIRDRVEEVRAYRAASKRAATRSLALLPALFGEIRQPKGRYLVIPRHSSEHRPFIPMDIRPATDIVGDSCAFVGSDDLYVAGVLMSTMHMAWVRQVCGRIKSDYRYSNKVVYNNYPWPREPSAQAKGRVRQAMEAVFEIRSRFEGEALGDLYLPALMPPALAHAHRKLDAAVVACYAGRTKLDSDLDRLSCLFELYRDYSGRDDRIAHSQATG